MVSLDRNCLTDAEVQPMVAWVRDTWQRLQPYSTGGVYLNFLGAEDRDADALTRAAYGPNYDRLVAAKRKYDPNNLFRLDSNIRP